jgi:hypothetical protein
MVTVGSELVTTQALKLQLRADQVISFPICPLVPTAATCMVTTSLLTATLSRSLLAMPGLPTGDPSVAPGGSHD